MTGTTKMFSLVFLTFLIAVLGFPVSIFSAGEVDSSFQGYLHGSTNGTINAVKRQPDGKVLVGGNFTDVNGTAVRSIARLNADGSVDETFSSQNLFDSFKHGANVISIAVQPDGKILVGGYFYTDEGVLSPGLRRIEANAARDTSFTTYSLFDGSINSIEVLADGKILIGGAFSGPGGTHHIARLNADGSVDSSFTGPANIAVNDIAVLADGSMLLAGYTPGSASTGLLRKLLPNGTEDPGFPEIQTSGGFDSVALKANGQILVTGDFTQINGFSLGHIALFNSNGSIDLTFNQNNTGVSTGLSVHAYDAEIAADGKIVVGGRFLKYNNVDRNCLARLESNGLLDKGFSSNDELINGTSVYDLEIEPGGSVLVGATSADYPLTVRRYFSDGTPDPAFRPIFSYNGRVEKIAKQNDGKIVVAGTFPYANQTKRNGLARFNIDGSLDGSFVPYSNSINIPIEFSALAIQPDGKLLVAETFADQVYRLNTDGSKETAFSPPFFGRTKDIAILQDGKILIGGAYGLKRLNSNGSNDTTFSASVTGVQSVRVQPDGKILIGGTFTSVSGSIRGRVARLNADGSLDTSFNPPGGANASVFAVEYQPDGKILVGGDFTSLNGGSNLRIGRFLPDGSVDAGFNQTADGTVRAIKLEAGGKIIVGGSFGFIQSQSHVGIVRLNETGTVDPTFIARANKSVYGLEIQDDQKVLAGGEFVLLNNESATRVVRLLNAAVPEIDYFDYDGDGKSDISILRPSTNRWYVLKSSTLTVEERTFGGSGDVSAPADYDGDGKTDIGIYRAASGDWWYVSSITGIEHSAHWGGAGDIPRPGDFDGDGKADFVVYRPAEGNWYRLGSTGATEIVNFGIPTDLPLVGDFDGDGKTDPAIFRPSSGDWWYRSSVTGQQLAVHWGISTDIPVPADYDGDGRTDLAVYRPSTGVWYVLSLGSGTFTILKFGLEEDLPVAADYDGDGKSDIAVFRPSTGIWYLLNTTSGFSALQFGASGDLPTPNSFVRSP
ncbi:MAG: FG-GAP-like repeat-containing protein [Pyrinomonadaceae bacterium]